MKKRGFTIVELLGVIIVISILAILVFNNGFKIFGKAKYGLDAIQLKNLEDAAILYGQNSGLRDCQTTCTGNDYLFSECFETENACKSDSKTSTQITLAELIKKEYFDDNNKSCGPSNAIITIYRYKGDYKISHDNIACIEGSSYDSVSNDFSSSSDNPSSPGKNDIKVTFSPNGNATTQSSHSTVVTVENASVLKYIWSNKNNADASSGTMFTSRDTITGTGMYDTKYLCIYAEDSNKNGETTCSNAFNFIANSNYLRLTSDETAAGAKFLNCPAAVTRNKVASITITDTNVVPEGVLGSWDVSEKENGSIMAWYKNSSTNGLYDVTIGQVGGVIANPNSANLFAYLTKATTINVSGLNTSKVTNMYYLFFKASSVVALDLSNFDTSKVLDISYMFGNCTLLETLDVSNFDTSNVTDSRQMFNSCSSLTSLDLSSFNTSKVTNMNNMFNGCTSLISLDIRNFIFTSVTAQNQMLLNVQTTVSITANSAGKTWLNSKFAAYTNITVV